MATRDELDRVGHDLAADERGLHALGAHGHAVRHGDGVELHGRAARGPDALLHELRQTPLVEVAGHRLDPGRGYTDDGLGQVLVGEAHRLEHGSSAGAIGTVGQPDRPDEAAEGRDIDALVLVSPAIPAPVRPVPPPEATEKYFLPCWTHSFL